MNDLGLFILKESQIRKSEIFSKVGLQAEISEFAILCGGFYGFYYKERPIITRGCLGSTLVCGSEIIPGRRIAIGNYLLNGSKTREEENYDIGWCTNMIGNKESYRISKGTVRKCYQSIVSIEGEVDIQSISNVGVRLAVPYSSISHNCLSKKVNEDGLLEVEFGEYPFNTVPYGEQKTIDSLYLLDDDSFYRTGKRYTIITTKGKSSCDEFVCNGKKYIRLKVELCNELFSPEEIIYNTGDYVWIEVKPIKWLVDKENDVAVSKSILANIVSNYICDMSFPNIMLLAQHLIDKCLSTEIIPSEPEVLKNEKTIDSVKLVINK